MFIASQKTFTQLMDLCLFQIQPWNESVDGVDKKEAEELVKSKNNVEIINRTGLGSNSSSKGNSSHTISRNDNIAWECLRQVRMFWANGIFSCLVQGDFDHFLTFVLTGRTLLSHNFSIPISYYNYQYWIKHFGFFGKMLLSVRSGFPRLYNLHILGNGNNFLIFIVIKLVLRSNTVLEHKENMKNIFNYGRC